MECSTEAGAREERAEALLFDVDSLYAHLARLHDRRCRRGVRYPLPIVLLFVVLAKLAGQDQIRGIAEWVGWRKEKLTVAPGLSRQSVPHHTTYSRVLGKAVCVTEMEALVSGFLQQGKESQPNVVVAVDGKTLRGTINATQPQGVHLLAAYLPGGGIVLMQLAVGGKENEIVVAPQLLQCVDLRDKVVTGNAMFAQRALSIQIVAAGGDYI